MIIRRNIMPLARYGGHGGFATDRLGGFGATTGADLLALHMNAAANGGVVTATAVQTQTLVPYTTPGADMSTYPDLDKLTAQLTSGDTLKYATYAAAALGAAALYWFTR